MRYLCGGCAPQCTAPPISSPASPTVSLGVSYAVTIVGLDPATRQILIGLLAASNFVNAGLQTAEAIIH